MTRPETPAARLLRIRRQLAAVLHQLSKATDPDARRALALKASDLKAGIQLLSK